MKVLLLISLIALISCNSEKKENKNPDGTFAITVGSTPPSINPIDSSTVGASTIQSYVIEGLLDIDIDTYEYRPGLAKSWTVSPDGMTYEFTLREGVTWHDGKPLTVEDVKFSFDIIFKDTYQTAVARSYFSNFHSPEIIGPHTIRFKAKTRYHKNLTVLGSGGYFAIVPKHIYDDPSDKSELNKTIIGSGPYILKEFKRGKWAKLEKNPNWWGRNIDHMKDQYHFGRVILRFIKGETAELENFKKGNLTFLQMNPEMYAKKSEGGSWGKKYHKVKGENDSVKGYSFIGFNLEKPMFKSVKVRKALSHLVNRELMIEKFNFGMSMPASGPQYVQNPYADKKLKPIDFNPEEALKLLRSDGWKDSDDDQVLDKNLNGVKTPLRFTLLIPNKDFEKFLTIFKEDAKRAGVDVVLKLIEWSSFMKHLDERSFDMVMLSWGGGGVHWDPKQVWHSDSIANSGSNFISYRNKKVDKLIMKARVTLDPEKRKPILQEVYRRIANDVPYIFLFNRKYELYGYQDGIWRPKDLFKYDFGHSYWKLAE